MSRQRLNSSGLTLVEMMVVLVIITGLMAFLFPAIQSSREAARAVVCQNNLRQLALAMSNHLEVSHSVPAPANWTVDLLPWMEESIMGKSLNRTQKAAAARKRPLLFVCPSHSSDQPFSTRPCLYVLQLNRAHDPKWDKVRWSIGDRQEPLRPEEIQPWYIGPEMLPNTNNKRQGGPHKGTSSNWANHSGSVWTYFPDL